MIILKKNLLYYKSSAPAPTPASFLLIDTTDTYILDYQITTGTETGIADIEMVSTFPTNIDWFRMIGYRDTSVSSTKWFFGIYGTSRTAYVGTQFGAGGDRTITISDVYNPTWDGKLYNKRNLYFFGDGYTKISETPGNWVEGDNVGTRPGGSDSWTSLIGCNIRIGLDSAWKIPYNLYGLRIYDTGSLTGLGNLVAEYIPETRGNVQGLYNTISGNFITKEA